MVRARDLRTRCSTGLDQEEEDLQVLLVPVVEDGLEIVERKGMQQLLGLTRVVAYDVQLERPPKPSPTVSNQSTVQGSSIQGNERICLA